MTFQVTRWRSEYYPSVKRMLVFDCLSEVSITQPLRTYTIGLNWGFTLLVELSIPTEGVFIRLLSTFHSGLQMNSCTTYLNVKRRLDHQTWLRESWEPMRLLGVVVELMKRSWTRLSRQKVEESSKVEKPQRPKKLQRSSVRRNQASWPPTLG